ncbi:MAG: PTS sorbitol transporter [Anaerolineales bacterium]|nr:PTS sorbitol transporter [Anaerolineales bacterium]
MGFWDKAKKVLIGDPPPPKEEKAPAAEEPAVEASAAQPTPAPERESAGSGEYKRVQINRGPRGWGGPLTIEPTNEKPLIYCVTGGGIHPVAQRIADLTGGQPFDGFKSKADFSEIAVAVIDCGGTARVGVYPMKGVLTVDIHSTSPSGPLMKYIKETNFVSGVTVDNIVALDD